MLFFIHFCVGVIFMPLFVEMVIHYLSDHYGVSTVLVLLERQYVGWFQFISDTCSGKVERERERVRLRNSAPGSQRPWHRRRAELSPASSLHSEAMLSPLFCPGDIVFYCLPLHDSFFLSVSVSDFAIDARGGV